MHSNGIKLDYEYHMPLAGSSCPLVSSIPQTSITMNMTCSSLIRLKNGRIRASQIHFYKDMCWSVE